MQISWTKPRRWSTLLNIFLLSISCLFQLLGQATQTTQVAIDPEKETLTQVVISGRVLPVLITTTGDTLFLGQNLDEVTITEKPIFENKIDEAFYNKYRRAAIVVFPYAIQAIRVFRQMETETKQLSEKQRKKYIKKLGNDLENEFEKPLKKLTRTQGRILVKMIERELHTPMYQLVKNLKGGWSAWRYNFMAGFYDYNLKSGYIRGEDPMLDEVLDDFNISYTIQQEDQKKY